MKAFLIVVLLLDVSTSSSNIESKTLEQWYNDVSDQMRTVKWGHPLFRYSHGFNHWNIKQKINFAQNKNKVLNWTQAMILIYRSGLDDLDVSKRNNFWTFMIESLIESNKRTTDVNYLECFRKELQDIDPDSPLVAGFDEHRMTIGSKACEQFLKLRGVGDYIDNVEKTYGNLTELTGGAVDRIKFKRFMLSTIVLADETDLNKSRETIFLIEELKDALDSAFAHVMNSLGTDDAGRPYGTSYSVVQTPHITYHHFIGS